jgi:hypothetical protein
MAYYSKVEVLVKRGGSIENHTFEKANLIISGNFIIISKDDGLSTSNKVFNLTDVSAYKTNK